MKKYLPIKIEKLNINQYYFTNDPCDFFVGIFIS